MENIVKEGPNVIKAHLKHLYDHGQKDFLKQAIDFLIEKKIKIPDYESETVSGSSPGTMEMDLGERPVSGQEAQVYSAELRNWPVQLQLLNPNAPYLKNADLLIAADCAPFAYANFHQRFLKDKILIIFCPKLDKTIEQYVDKLTNIFKNQDIKSISIVQMEVPCCSGIEVIVRRAIEKSHKNIIIKGYTISIKGEII